jgi:hypothetical protein
VRRTSLVVCLSLALSACGSSGTNDVQNAILACRSFATAECNVEAACQVGVDANSCIQLLEARDGCDAVTCGTYTYSPTAAQRCLTDLKNQSCQDSNANLSPASCAQNLICVPPA